MTLSITNFEIDEVLTMSQGRSPVITRGNPHRRYIDHVLGSPVVFLIGLLHHRRPRPNRVSSVAILSPSAIGDTIIASALARDLKTLMPECRVTVFIAPS